MTKLEIKDPELRKLVKSANAYGNLFINSMSAVKTQTERVDGKIPVDYYTVRLISWEDLGVNGSYTFFQGHNSDGTEAIWKDVSPTIVQAMHKAMTNTGEIPGFGGLRIVKLEYYIPYLVDNKEIYSDTFVYSESKEFETILRKRLEKNGLVQRKVAEMITE